MTTAQKASAALAAVIAAASLIAGGSAPASASTTPPIGFSTPTVMDPMESVGEPTIVHSPAADNTVYASGPWGTGTQRSIWNASADGGETFRLVQQCPPTSGNVSGPCPAPTAATGTANPPGGGDTDQRLDSKGKDYFADLWALACDRVATTTDHGATAKQFAYGCNSPTANPSTRPDGSDRQWLAVFDPALTHVTSTAPDVALAPLSYMEYNNLQTTQTGCSYWVKSTDGIHYSPANNDNGNFGCDGYPSVDQTTGKVFEASDCNGGLCLNIGTPDASGNLCFLDDNGAETIGGTPATCPNGGGIITVVPAAALAGSPSLLFTVSSMDTGRNLHLTYAVNGAVTGTTSTFQVFTTVASAASGWTLWAKPVQVSQSPSNVNVFPWVVAGGPGRSDSVWYGTDSYIDPSTNGGQQWNVWMSQVVWPLLSGGAVDVASVNAGTRSPTATMVKVSPHPNHLNSICLQGTGCITSQGDRNLADFFTVTIDHTGAAEVEYDDTSNQLLQQGFQPGAGLVDHRGAPVVTIARQDSGPGLYGKLVSPRPHEPTSAPTTGQWTKAGNALYPVIGGTNVSALDLVNDPGPNKGNQVYLSKDGSTVTLEMNPADLSSAGTQAAFSKIPGANFLQYVTRWVMCDQPLTACTIYYGMAEISALGGPSSAKFFGGKAESIDLCSVSACDPHVERYPESAAVTPAGTGAPETGSISCPSSPSATNPCTIMITVKASDVGNPTATSLFEEIGSYSFASAYLQSQLTNPQAESDLLPLLVDGICCFNYQRTHPQAQAPAAPLASLMLGAGGLVGATATLGIRRRRRLEA